MRRRLVAALVGVAVVTLLLYAAPRAFMIAGLVRQQEERALDRSADLVAQTIDLQVAAGEPVDPVTLGALVRDGEALAVELADGTVVEAGDVGAGPTVDVRRSLAGGGSLTLRLDTAEVDERVAEAMVPVVLAGTTVVLLAVLLALTMARRLARPFTDLARYADELGGNLGSAAPRSGVAEADHLAEALDRGRSRIAELVHREREFSSNASHQLRTPLAALRLRLEDLQLWPEVSDPVREELAESLAEVDRLAGTVTDLLSLARSGGIGAWEDIDLLDSVEEAVGRWQPRFEAEGRRLLVLPTSQRPVVATAERAVQQILDVLFENGLVHGRGYVDVYVECAGDHATVRVTDEGRLERALTGRVFQRAVRSPESTGSGIGLSVARTVAESIGARLQLVSRDPTVFELSVPAGSNATADGGSLTH
jgi:signal transduction histidine kinase